MTKEEKKWMNTLMEEHLIQDMGEEYFDFENDEIKAEARRHFRAGYIAGFTKRNENDSEDA